MTKRRTIEQEPESTDESLPASTTPEQPEFLRDVNQLTRGSYTAYGQVTDFKNYQGLSMPLFDELPETIRKAWSEAVRYVMSNCPNQ